MKKLQLTVLFAGLCFSALNSEAQPSFLTNGLVAYYPFDGNANDMVETNNGTPQGATLTTNRFGYTNSAYYFNGVDSGMTGVYADGGNADPNPLTSNFACSLWFNAQNGINIGPVSTSGTAYWAFQGNINNPYWTTSDSGIGISAGTNGVIIYEYANVLIAPVIVQEQLFSPAAWVHMVVTVTNNEAATLYLNGVYVTTGLSTGRTKHFTLFDLCGSGYGKFCGSLDDIRVYNRSLSSNEVAQLYAFETSSVAITNQPQSATNNLGDTVGLSVGASGGNPQDYTWYFSRTNIDNGTNSILTISNISQPFFGNYYVVVTNAFSSVTSIVATLFEPATITVQPTNVVVPLQSTATFTVQAVGYPAPTYQWTLNGTNIVNGTNLTKPNITGANSNTLTIPNILLSNVGNYQVIVSNSIGTATSSIATLNMFPSITSPFMGGTPIWGTSATLSIGAIGSGTLTYQWYLNGQPISGANYPQLNFASIQFTNDGFYSVVISSPYGSVTNVAEQVAVNPAVVTLGFYPGLTINGAPGDSYMIQSSSNLANTNNWTTLTNLTLTQPVQTWVDMSVDASSPLNNQFFYRLVPQP